MNYRLAFITFVDDRGQDVGLNAIDIARMHEHPAGSMVLLHDGTSMISGSTVADMVIKIATAAAADPIA